MSESQQELARDLGFLEAYTIGLGTMIGAGIFVLPSIAASNAGPASMISFAVGGGISLLAALSLSELATGMPKAGGSYYFVNRALGSFFGSIVGWGMWGGLMFASAFYMLGFGQYLTYFVPMGRTGIAVAALIGALLLTALNYYGVHETGQLQNVIVLLLVGLIVVFVTFGVLDVDSVGEFNPYGWGNVLATIGTVYVSFIGFEVIATSAEEIKNPGRNLPLSMIAAVVTPTILYVFVMYISTGTMSNQALFDSNIPVADVAELVMGGFDTVSVLGVVEFSMGELGALAMVVGALMATVSSANASILSAARVNFAMGRDRILTNWLNEVHDRFRTPYRAIVVTGVVILVLIAADVPIGTLAEVASFAYLVTYSLVHVAVVVMRRADPPNYEPDFRIPSGLYPIVPVLGFVACLWVLFQMDFEVQIVGLIIVVAGMLWYVAYARGRDVRDGLVGEALAPTAGTGARAADGEGPYRVVVPVANPETEGTLLRLAAASAHAHEGDAEIVAVNVIEVPQQTSLEQDLQFEEERVERQRELLDAAREMAADLDVGLRTRAIVGRNAGDVVLNVVAEEGADHVLLGWKGHRSAREHVLGSTIDPVVEDASCEATLVKLGTNADEGGSVLVLAGQGPHAPVAARRGAEFVDSAWGGSLTLMNVQSLTADDEDPEVAGRQVVEEVVEAAGLESGEYEAEVLVSEDVEDAVLETAATYDTVCVGSTRAGAVEQALFGSLPETIGEQVDGTVAMARGAEGSPRSIREALVELLSR